jgi:hypothetical protein
MLSLSKRSTQLFLPVEPVVDSLDILVALDAVALFDDGFRAATAPLDGIFHHVTLALEPSLDKFQFVVEAELVYAFAWDETW